VKLIVSYVEVVVNHSLGEAYLTRLRTFEKPNPGAYQFLRRLEQEGPAQGLWLSCATGVHLYKNHAFLAHILLSNSKSKPFWLVFGKHDLIWTEAYDASHLLLPHPLVRLVMQSSGFRAGWAAARAGIVELKPNTPAAFYDVLFGTLGALQTEEAQSVAVS
jgi:hypothetical protein